MQQRHPPVPHLDYAAPHLGGRVRTFPTVPFFVTALVVAIAHFLILIGSAYVGYFGRSDAASVLYQFLAFPVLQVGWLFDPSLESWPLAAMNSLCWGALGGGIVSLRLRRRSRKGDIHLLRSESE